MNRNVASIRPGSAITLPDANDPYAQIAAERGGEFGKLLRYEKGRWLQGENEVPIGTQFLAVMSDAMRGYVRFQDGKPAERRIGFVRDRFPMPARASLGFTDESKWEKAKGVPRDPWSPQHYLPMVHLESTELHTFIFRSAGAMQTFGDLCRAYSPMRNSRMLPIVSLQTDKYRHPDYGMIDTPVLKIESWEEAGGAPSIGPADGEGMKDITPVRPKNDLDDDIPF
jgi:hypothetical protein